MKNVIALIAVAGIAGAAAAQSVSYDVSFDGGATFNNNVVVAPGDTVTISVWYRGADAIANFGAFDIFAFNFFVEGAADIGGFTSFTEQTNAVETMPNPSATALTGWNTAADTWVQGRRPGAGTAFGGGLSHNGWRFAPSVGILPATITSVATGNGFQLLKGGSADIDGFQANGVFVPAFTSEHIQTSTEVEIFRIVYTPESIGDHDVRIVPVGGTAFAAGNFQSSTINLFGLIEGSIGTITVIPAPGAFALLGLGGLAAARRRR
jgi:hypothetical protein